MNGSDLTGWFAARIGLYILAALAVGVAIGGGLFWLLAIVVGG